MSQNFSSYSENDSADIQLSADIQKLIAPEVKSSAQVKFDGYGTLHVLERNSEGALLSDSYLDKQDEEFVGPSEEYTSMDRLEHVTKVNSALKRALAVQRIMLILFGVGFVLFCILLKLTLDRFM